MAIQRRSLVLNERAKLRSIIALVLALVLCHNACHAARTGPDGRVRAVCLGDVIEQYGTYNSFTVVRYDPAIRATLIPSRPDYVGGYENAYRNMRMYMPRTYQKLVEDYDLIISSDAHRLVFKPEWIHWLSSSVTDNGLGMLWLGSIEAEVIVGWDGTTVAEVLPARQAPGQYTRDAMFWLRIVDPDEALMQALPWEKSPALANVNAQVPKDASSQWAKVQGLYEEHPLMTYWEIGGGAVLNFASKFPVGVMPWAEDWNLFPQAMIYMVYRVADKTLPDDPFLFQSVTNHFIEFTEMNSLLDSILVWVEKFGGNPDKLRARFEALVDVRTRAEEAYLNGDFDQALAILSQAEAEHASIRLDAMKAKDEALFWVYLTEWCALMGTLMISSYAIWALMVRRKLYKEVGVSRLDLRIE